MDIKNSNPNGYKDQCFVKKIRIFSIKQKLTEILNIHLKGGKYNAVS